MPYSDVLVDFPILAKSQSNGGQTLPEHTWSVLACLAQQKHLRPNLFGVQSTLFWERLYWAGFLHDFGKVATGFQAMLQGNKGDWFERGHRHEVLSLAFIDWLFPKGHPDRYWVIGAVVSHHRDADVVLSKYGGYKTMRDLSKEERETIQAELEDIASHLDAENVSLLWQWLKSCAVGWADSLGLSIAQNVLPASQPSLERPHLLIYAALRDWAVWQSGLSDDDKYLAYLMRGLMHTADHAGSAGVTQFPPLPLSHEVAEKPLTGLQKRSHQQEVAQMAAGSSIMIAPTGSGKTEAAILWASHQNSLKSAPRLFYTLPYQASMNAMAERIADRYFDIPREEFASELNTVVTLQHSRALSRFYEDLVEYTGYTAKDAAAAAKNRKNLAGLNTFPIQVFSPYQMLKAAYSLKFYEKLLVDYSDALFIFDEIHAYDPRRMALIIGTLHWLKQHFHARFLIMTATLPPTVRQAIVEALSISSDAFINASPEVFAASRRHIVQILDGSLFTDLTVRVAEDIEANKNVLVCCNQVRVAQEIYSMLTEEIDISPDNIILLHSGFNGEDRSKKETSLLNAVGVEKRRRDREQGRQTTPVIIVATQVVEVSLDIDLDTIYTDPAPLEALLQRFGRVNRGRRGEPVLCPVHIYREPASHELQPDGDRDKAYLPYSTLLVQEGMRVLEERCSGQAVDESQVTSMLEEIYQGEIAEQWWTEYRQTAREFEDVILGEMKPFYSADAMLHQRFYEMFDGTQAVPVACIDDYLNAVENRDYLGASKYLVNISWQRYHILKTKGYVREDDDLKVLLIPYNSETGLQHHAV